VATSFNNIGAVYGKFNFLALDKIESGILKKKRRQGPRKRMDQVQVARLRLPRRRGMAHSRDGAGDDDPFIVPTETKFRKHLQTFEV
jgi:hypothetical protein